MESQPNIFHMVDEMGSVLLTLQSNVIKVMDGINQLNLIISKIKQYKANNNMMNNMMGNMMGNMMNNFQNINMGMNNMMNIPNMQMPMNAMMNNMNIQNNFSIDDLTGWHLLFENTNINDKITIDIIISEQKLIKEAISKYMLKAGRTDKLKFIFDGHGLNPETKICESGLQNMSRILVISTENILGG